MDSYGRGMVNHFPHDHSKEKSFKPGKVARHSHPIPHVHAGGVAHADHNIDHTHMDDGSCVYQVHDH